MKPSLASLNPVNYLPNCISSRLPTKEQFIQRCGQVAVDASIVVEVATVYIAGIQALNRMGVADDQSCVQGMNASITSLDDQEAMPWAPVVFAAAAVSLHVFRPAVRSCTEKCATFLASIGSKPAEKPPVDGNNAAKEVLPAGEKKE